MTEFKRPILSVIAPHSRSGKTLFITQFLPHVHGVGCLKISPVNAVRLLSSTLTPPDQAPFGFADSVELNRAETDSCLYIAAGASHVELLRCPSEHLAAALKAALDHFPPSMPVVVESSGAVELLKPGAVVLVMRPPVRTMKPGTKTVLPLVTDLLINASDTSRPSADEAVRLREAFPALRPRFVWHADLGRESLPEGLLSRVQDVLIPSAP